MLITFERIGPVQDQTVALHLWIELVKQAIRWGAPCTVWMYPFERWHTFHNIDLIKNLSTFRLIGLLTRSIKSKQANIVNRFQRAMAPLSTHEEFKCVFEEDKAANDELSKPDKFPKRHRNREYKFTTTEMEVLHNFLQQECQGYRVLVTEWRTSINRSSSTSPWKAISTWTPWSDGHVESNYWQRSNRVAPSLTSLLLSCTLPQKCRPVFSGVRRGGEMRRGTKTNFTAFSGHDVVASTFKFKRGDVFKYGRILFMFQLLIMVC